MDYIGEMVARVANGQDPGEVLEGVLRQRTRIISKSRSSLAGRELTRRASSGQTGGWEYRLGEGGANEVEVNEIIRYAKNRGTVQVIAPESKFPIASVSFGSDGWIIEVYQPPDFAINLPSDPEIRAASRRTYGKNDLSAARDMVSLIVSKVKMSRPLGSGLIAA
jgi:hypothetical protein